MLDRCIVWRLCSLLYSNPPRPQYSIWHGQSHHFTELPHRLSWYYWDRTDWFKSYLLHRKFTINIGDSCSSHANFNCGVPQGSIWGPILFSIHASSWPYHQEAQHLLPLLWYVDDTVILDVNLIPTANFNYYLADIKCWMSQNFIQLYESKSVNLANQAQWTCCLSFSDLEKLFMLLSLLDLTIGIHYTLASVVINALSHLQQVQLLGLWLTLKESTSLLS